MLNRGYIYRDRIQRDDGQTVLQYYLLHYPRFDEAEWRRRIEGGMIRLKCAGSGTDVVSAGGIVPGGDMASGADTILMCDERLRAGDVLEYHRPPWREPDVPEIIDVLHEDERCAVLHKPSGLPVLPGGGYLENTMLHKARILLGAGMAPVHRLGRGTTGAILFARDSDAGAVLSKAMRTREIQKVYLALASGTEMPDRFTVATPIGPVAHPLLGRIHAASAEGKPSISHCRVLSRCPSSGTSLIEVNIPTGRPHQIRIHLAAAGWPLAGDPLYAAGGQPYSANASSGRPAVPGDCGYLLHSWRIAFPYPSTGRRRTICAPPTPELRPPSPLQ